MRVGLGFDVHAFEDGRPLVLGGVRITGHAGLAGHSDADVVLHAVADALLGAAGLGDLGSHFPSDDPVWEGADSAELLRIAYAEVTGRGWRAGNVDVTVVAQAPRLGPHLDAMRDGVARILGLERDAVSVKVTSTDRLGSIGRAEGIAAYAVALVERLG